MALFFVPVRGLFFALCAEGSAALGGGIAFGLPRFDETDVAICRNLWYGNNRALHERQAVGYILREEVVDMPITITLHIFGCVVTIRIKGENRHPGR